MALLQILRANRKYSNTFLQKYNSQIFQNKFALQQIDDNIY